MIAYELTAEFSGTVDDVDENGNKIGERPVFQGAELAIADTTFNIGDALEHAEQHGHPGVIVVDDANQPLVVLLDAVDALKRAKVPEGATPYSAYNTLPKAVLLELAQRRGLPGYTTMTGPNLAAALERLDAGASGGATTEQTVETGNVAAPTPAPTFELQDGIRVEDLDDAELTSLVDGLPDDQQSPDAQAARAELERRTTTPDQEA